jgi:hypothetical protein
MTQNDFRKRLHDLTVEATRALPMVQVFEMLTSHQHAFQFAYETSLADKIRLHCAENPQQESPP